MRPLIKRFITVVVLCFVSIAFTSCGSSGPKPEGRDFLTKSTQYGRKGAGRGSAFVSPDAPNKLYKKVGVMPFRAPIELVGVSISDMFTTELLKTYKYKLIERSQIEQVLDEQALSLKGVTDSSVALKIGRMLGVDAVIVGTVPEYGMRAVGEYELPAVGINVRMIDGETGSIVWSITDSAIAGDPISLSVFANRMVESMMYRLSQEWIRSGDTQAVHLPKPEIISQSGMIRGAQIEVMGNSPSVFSGYKLMRSRTKRGSYGEIAIKENKKFGQVIKFEDERLLDAETYYYKVVGVSPMGLTSLPAQIIQITTIGPPAQVSGLKAQSALPRRVNLTWEASYDTAVKEYVIYRSIDKNGGYEKIKVIKGKEKSQYLDKGKGGGFFGGGAGLEDFTKYYYKIVAVNVVDVEGQKSEVAYAITKPVPVGVDGLGAGQNEVKQVSLKWKLNPEQDIEKYEIFRGNRIDDVDNKIESVSGSVSSFIDDDRKDGASYFYKIRAVDKDKLKGEFSTVVGSHTKPVPVKPLGLEAALKSNGVKIRWEDNPERDIVRYEVHVKGFMFWCKEGESAASSHVYNGEMAPGKTLTFRVVAVDSTELKSEPSDVVSVSIPKEN